MKGKALRKHSLHEKTAASVLLKPFFTTCQNSLAAQMYCHKGGGTRGVQCKTGSMQVEHIGNTSGDQRCWWTGSRVVVRTHWILRSDQLVVIIHRSFKGKVFIFSSMIMQIYVVVLLFDYVFMLFLCKINPISCLPKDLRVCIFWTVSLFTHSKSININNGVTISTVRNKNISNTSFYFFLISQT